MKKVLFLFAILFATAVTVSAQQTDFKKVAKEAAKETDSTYAKKIKELVTVNVDTLIVKDSVKFIQIAGKKYAMVSFKQEVVVFLYPEAWNAVLEIINTRDYGKLPNTFVSQIIQGIGQQLPPKQ